MAIQLTNDVPVRIVLVEDEPLFRELLCIALNLNTHLEIVGSFADGAAALEAVPQLRPSVALLDIELKGDINGVQLGLPLRNALPALGVVLLSNHAEPQFLAAVRREALVGWSYLLKRSVGDVATLGRVIEGAESGLVVLDPLLVSQLRSGHTGHLARLTPRQREILELMAQGYSIRQSPSVWSWLASRWRTVSTGCIESWVSNRMTNSCMPVLGLFRHSCSENRPVRRKC